MLISYADKKKKGTKVVLALSTMHDEMRISKDERKKPAPIVYYDHMKGGVAIVDLLSTMLSTRFQTKRWPCNANFFICDSVRTNARTVYNECNRLNLSNFEFTWMLGKELVLPFIQQRYANPIGVQSVAISKMKRVLELNNIAAPILAVPIVAETSKGYCYQCLAEIYGPEYKKKKAKLNNKLTSKCMTCEKTVCRKENHCYVICGACKQ